MKKNELIRRIAQTSQQKINVVQEVFDATFDELRALLLEGESYSIERFVGFKPVIRRPRKGRNPLTGEEVVIPAMMRVKMVPSQAFKQDLKNQTKKFEQQQK